jgi:hypothetical protein
MGTTCNKDRYRTGHDDGCGLSQRGDGRAHSPETIPKAKAGASLNRFLPRRSSGRRWCAQ